MAFRVWDKMNIPNVDPDTDFWLEDDGEDRVVLKAMRGDARTTVLSITPEEGVVFEHLAADVGLSHKGETRDAQQLILTLIKELQEHLYPLHHELPDNPDGTKIRNKRLLAVYDKLRGKS